jgi:hypothetical protein
MAVVSVCCGTPKILSSNLTAWSRAGIRSSVSSESKVEVRSSSTPLLL